ncbi:hypothetical protein IMG5_047960 [Ichthyophthirius multifiliis]|uniref:tRNA synthetases class I catalytic domain-containing protein n=1 Tax=Ichthyophthirius multifiliis TaxID=5932 RepID=G0QME7_ICHMU|nr:hypothetical protein IMG5_047960 [Ichthyophthirius multifiliis]EGR33616.1 hypothetical protein IMG5_047960 [Ichthyophthirius multifiliis]|eukprot:XP_004037602.1 hypothetical protein IMG5_047960 [Ichthyophthirius multifiliis]
MKGLNIQKPDIIARVSEYVPEIIQFIQKIIQNGYAYSSNNSVYFNVEKFHNSPNHIYAKLNSNSQNQEQIDDDNNQDKKSSKDFVLWKKSKENEPKWDSPWGQGRPGWHIECSSMASNFFGDKIDIHMGGQDLKFPHHDNEIAQSEAFFNCQVCNQWVNYFLHTGHLNIEGLKMSKSLKNFISIQNLLEKYEGRVIRLMFLKSQYDQLMDYNEKQIQEAQYKDKKYWEFLSNLQCIICQKEEEFCQFKFFEKENEIKNEFEKCKKNVHFFLQNNFNIPKVLKEIEDLIQEVNIYLKQKPYNIPLLESIYKYVSFILECFGIFYFQQQQNAYNDDKFIQVVDIIKDFSRLYKTIIRLKLPRNYKGK